MWKLNNTWFVDYSITHTHPDFLSLSGQLYKVLFPYTPTKDDELVLTDGDYVYVHASDSGHTGTKLITSCNTHMHREAQIHSQSYLMCLKVSLRGLI